MMQRSLLLGLLAAVLWASPALAAKTRPPALTAEAVNAAQWSARPGKGKLDPLVLKAQVLLDRARFSPGVIDVRGGENFAKALKAFQQANNLDATGKLDAATWTKLAETSAEEALTRYTIGERDVKGPFVQAIPKDYRQMAELRRLAYRSPRELLAEKFHMSEDLLSALNSGTNFDRAGVDILVAGVAPIDGETKVSASRTKIARNKAGDGDAMAAAGVRVEVNKSERSVRAYAKDGSLIAYYPASVGSAEKPAPSGRFSVREVARDPTYRYDPKYAFKGQKATQLVKVAPGPNNPVGLVWIELSAESYGIHGTPAPESVSKTESHGCIRLTNWDALALAKLVKKGTPVDFVD
jgi:lipoprotein-anchoring transpeptidase ErfK/SrfK